MNQDQNIVGRASQCITWDSGARAEMIKAGLHAIDEVLADIGPLTAEEQAYVSSQLAAGGMSLSSVPPLVSGCRTAFRLTLGT